LLHVVLIVSYGGSKTFRVLTYRNGKPQSRKLGSYPAVSVKDARAKAREYWQNPQKFEAQAEVGTFKSVAAEWVRRHVEANKLRSQHEIERLLERRGDLESEAGAPDPVKAAPRSRRPLLPQPYCQRKACQGK
jgi:hypothetical protein